MSRLPRWPRDAYIKLTLRATGKQFDRWKEASEFYHYLLIEPFLVAAADHSSNTLLRLKARQQGRIARGEL